MAIYTTFFVCEPGSLQAAFPAWKAPLARPVMRQHKDPFTGKVVARESREPDWSDAPSAGREERSVVSVPQKDYAKYLEERLPPAVRALPHWCAKA